MVSLQSEFVNVKFQMIFPRKCFFAVGTFKVLFSSMYKEMSIQMRLEFAFLTSNDMQSILVRCRKLSAVSLVKSTKHSV